MAFQLGQCGYPGRGSLLIAHARCNPLVQRPKNVLRVRQKQ